MNYQKIHNQIIKKAQLRASSKKEANLILGYSERHHIIPKCMGGTNDKTNLVFLSAREHFIIHILLTKIYSLEPKLLYACHRLMYDKKGNRLNGKFYDSLKKKINDYQKSLNKDNDEGYAISAAKRRGRTKETCQSVAAMAEKLSGRTKETHEGVAAMAEKMKGRNKINNEGYAIRSQKMSGRTKKTHEGLARSSEKQTGRTKETHEYLNVISQKAKERTKETHESRRVHAEKIRKIPLEFYNEVYIRRKEGISGKDVHLWLINELGFNVNYSCISRIFTFQSNIINSQK